MSLQYNNTTTKRGIVQMMEDKAGFDDGFISGNALRMLKWTARANNALDSALAIIFKAGGTWQFDDTNHDKYNIIYADIVSGQADYTFVTDGQGNLILDIYKVFRMRSSTGIYEPIDPVDVASEAVRASFYDNLGVVGIPTQYDKNGNGILFDIIPNYNATKGIMIYISREGSYFVVGDTTKMPGFAGLFHKYIAIHAVHDWGRLNLSADKFNKIDIEKQQLERDISEYYGQREHDVRPVMSPRVLNPRTGKYRDDEI